MIQNRRIFYDKIIFQISNVCNQQLLRIESLKKTVVKLYSVRPTPNKSSLYFKIISNGFGKNRLGQVKREFLNNSSLWCFDMKF